MRNKRWVLLPGLQESSYFRGYIDRTNLSLNYAGVVVFLATLFAPTKISERACPSPQKKYWNDWGKTFFIAGFLFRFFAVPLFGNLFKRLLKEKAPSKQIRNLIESEILDSVETAIPVLLLFLQTWKNAKGASFLAVFSLWPLIALVLHAFDPSFSRGTLSDYKRYFNYRYQWISASLLEGIYNGWSLSAAFTVLEPLAMNIGYDSTHSEPLPEQPMILNICMGAGFLLGLTSIAHPKLLSMMRFTEGATNSFFYVFMFTISSLFCLSPTSMSDEGFEKYGWAMTLFFGVVALFFACFGGLGNREFGYKDHQDVYFQLFSNGSINNNDDLAEETSSSFNCISSALFKMKQLSEYLFPSCRRTHYINI